MKAKPVKERFKEWLGEEGIEFFKGLVQEYGTVLAVYNEGGIPHSVHFREGMQVRNWMRLQPEFNNKEKEDIHWFDNNWSEFTESSIK